MAMRSSLSCQMEAALSECVLLVNHVKIYAFYKRQDKP